MQGWLVFIKTGCDLLWFISYLWSVGGKNIYKGDRTSWMRVINYRLQRGQQPDTWWGFFLMYFFCLFVFCLVDLFSFFCVTTGMLYPIITPSPVVNTWRWIVTRLHPQSPITTAFRSCLVKTMHLHDVSKEKQLLSGFSVNIFFRSNWFLNCFLA